MDSNDINNSLSELESLKKEYDSLREKFDKQEILNERLLQSALVSKFSYFARYRAFVWVIYPLVGLFFAWLIFSNLHLNIWLGISLLALFAVSMCFELILTRRLCRNSFENCDLHSFACRVKRVRKAYGLFYIVATLISLIWLCYFYMAVFHAYTPAADFVGPFFWRLSVLLPLAIVTLIFGYRRFCRHCNDLVRQIEAPETPAPRRRRWLTAIISALVVLWALFGFFAMYKGIPPFGKRPVQTEQYIRLAGDTSTSGSFSIWEISTAVSLPSSLPQSASSFKTPAVAAYLLADTAAVSHSLPDSDSIIFRWGAPNSDGSLPLYALKKTTPQGPALSSAVVGAPIIEKVEVSDSDNSLFIQMLPEAAALFHQITLDLSTRSERTYIAIMVGRTVWSAPAVVGVIPQGACCIPGNFSRQQADSLASEIVAN